MMNSCMSNVDETVSAGACVVDSMPSMAAQPEFAHLTEMRRYIYRAIAAVHDESFNTVINHLLRQFECAIREELELAQSTPLLCRKLARKVIGLTHLIHTIQEGREENALESSTLNRERWCFIVANYIACELCGAQERVEREQGIIERIGSMLSLYIEPNDVGFGAYKENTLRTLIAVPKLFGQANIITAFYSRLFPQWSSTSSLFSQAELADKIYIEYIIIFYYWQRLERNEATKQRIFDFAVKFMRPSCSLPFNPAYMDHLPKYTDASTATRSILEFLNVKQCCRGLHSASKLDNRSKHWDEDIILDSDEEDVASDASLALISSLISTQQPEPTPPPAPDPPDFLKTLCRNASRLEPVKRATALYRGIDSTCEVVDLCESEEEEEMFSLDFSVPANVDGEPAVAGDDDYVAITRIYPSNLRTYQRATSSAATAVSPTLDEGIYTMPRIVNSYSCRRDSLHLVSTTQLPHLIDQCVQTAEHEDEEQQHEQMQQPHQLQQSFENNDAISSCMPHSETRPSDSTTTTELIYEGSFNHRTSSQDSTHIEFNDNHFNCHQSSSPNSHSSNASLQKKQVSFSAQHLPASSKAQLKKSHKSIKPSIKRNNNSNKTSPNSSMEYIDSLKLMGRKEHLLASQRMFSKLEAKKNCDKVTINSKSSSSRHTRKPTKNSKKPCTEVANVHTVTPIATPTPIPTIQLTPTTSNASSSTPTPQLNRLQPRGTQRSLPTPPASTDSSMDAYHRRRLNHRQSTDSVQNSVIQQAQALSKKYKFNRRKFADYSADNIEFYKSLLKLQRQKLREHRQAHIKETELKLNPVEEPKTKSQHVKAPKPKPDQDAVKKRLVARNNKLRKNIEKLESDIELIKKCAPLAREKMINEKIASMPTVVVRLKRVSIHDFEAPRNKVEDSPKELVPQKQQRSTRKRRRRNRTGWSRIKNINKKKRLAKLAEELSKSTADTSPLTHPSSTAAPILASDRVPAEVLAPVPNPDPKPVPAPAPAHESVSASANSAAELDCIAAYVTLANNGESCTEEDAVMKQITQELTPCPEAEQSCIVAAHEIVVATSNVPVYLLNGESRDVTTPVPTNLSSEQSLEDGTYVCGI